MCIIVLLLLVSNVQVNALFKFRDFISKNTFEDNDELTGYRKGVSVTGRVFVTMFGFPPKCEKRGKHHSCTLSFACWLAGGSSQSGCGTSPWIVACCVTSKNSKIAMKNQRYSEEKLEMREDSVPVLEKRMDEGRDGDIEEESCGLSSDRMFGKRIIGGKEAVFGQLPWQALIKIATFQCGGVLVSRRFVASAAHCIISAKLKDIVIYLGELDTQDTGLTREYAPAELHRIKRRIMHPKFQYRATQPDRYDMALLEMITLAGDAAHIIPICLPEPGLELIGREAVVAGWGKIKPSSDLQGTNILRSATVPILDISDCSSWHRSKHIHVDLHDEMLCAGHENGRSDACLGDSGGPLIVLERGRWTLVGITSAGFGCGQPHQPGIYHRVGVSLEWILSVIKEKNRK